MGNANLSRRLPRAARRLRSQVVDNSTARFVLCSGVMRERQYAVSVDGTKITFECPHGHRYTQDMAGKRRKIAQRMGVGGARMMASWWSREKGGCIGDCPVCKREAK